MTRKHFSFVFTFALAILFGVSSRPSSVLGDAGVLLPSDEQQPDPSVLSLEEMDVTIQIDNGDARVFIRQIFANHTASIQEGTYIFALPSRATVSDFAVWDGPTRIPAVILERKRAQEIYNALKAQAIDPGLLGAGESDNAEATRTNVFNAKITPIPAYGTKRLEIEYHESIPVENLKSYFVLPLHPDAYHAQVAEHLTIHFELDSAHPILNFRFGGKTYPLAQQESDAHGVKGTFEGQHVLLGEDFSITYQLDPAGTDKARVLTYRQPESGQPNPTEMSPERNVREPGFFETEALLGFGNSAVPSTVTVAAPGASATAAPPKTVVLLFDTSLSMQWDKLERSYMALERILHSLKPADKFNLLLFNTELSPFQPSPVAADPATIEKAIDFVRASRLRGGTDLQQALRQALAQCASNDSPDPYVVLLSDGGATSGIVQNGKLAAWYATEWKKLPPAERPRTYIFAVGDDANLPLLKMLARNDCVLESVLSTEPADFKLDSFLSKIGRSPVAELGMNVAPRGAVDLVYPLQDSAFAGSVASWVGEYHEAARGVAFDVSGVREGQPFDFRETADLPEKSLDHPQLPRLWARARVDALLEKIERDGEDQATIDEIVQLSRKYKLVTPYTSFLAVPRALLRPRVIRPGDPVLRVRTDESIVSVVALFPFGLVQELRYLPQDDIWQTRFLAPADMRDGTYDVRLILRDKLGHTYRESKSFVIASTPPTVQIRLDRTRFHRGETVALRVNASESTRTLVARMEGADSTFLHWDSHAGANTGQIVVPPDLPVGTYPLTVTAEDIAHNTGSQEVQIEILP
ncbi:MAG: VIT domain-containing protein [Candidatus Acidiferrales bacterium]